MILLPKILSDDKDFIKFCNDLRCPLCESQLDGNIHPKLAALYCARNNKEYIVSWRPNSEHPDREQILYLYPQYEYIIDIILVAGQYRTNIYRYNADMSEYHKASTQKIMLEVYGARTTFFRKRMEEEIFLKKLKTYQVFS